MGRGRSDRGRRGDLLPRQHGARGGGHRAVDRNVDGAGVEPELPLGRTGISDRRRCFGRLRPAAAALQPRADAVRAGAALPHLPQLQGLPRTDRGGAAAGQADRGPELRHDRGARSRYRRQGPDVAVAPAARPAVRDGRRA